VDNGGGARRFLVTLGVTFAGLSGTWIVTWASMVLSADPGDHRDFLIAPTYVAFVVFLLGVGLVAYGELSACRLRPDREMVARKPLEVTGVSTRLLHFPATEVEVHRATPRRASKDQLQRQMDEGTELRSRLHGFDELATSMTAVLHRATPADVTNWIERTEAVMASEPRLLAEFRLKALPPQGVIEIYDHHVKSEEQRNMDQRLHQLEQIIRALR
jgi:hypothetical protein